jgi:uncharacterized membrane protein YkvA (DUF1232 family)
MRLSAPTITDDPLPLSLPKTPAPSTPLLDPAAVAHFDALLHELNPDAVRVDRERVLGLCGWLASMPVQAAQDVLARRLCRLDELRAMLDDPDWDADEAVRARVSRLVGYADQVDDLIPDREPLLGKLDDVLLLELAWPAFAAEAEDYRDFCAYRDEAQPCGNGGEQRAAWIRDRLAEAALWQHHLRVNDSHYSRRGHAEAPFHVGG